MDFFLRNLCGNSIFFNNPNVYSEFNLGLTFAVLA